MSMIKLKTMASCGQLLQVLFPIIIIILFTLIGHFCSAMNLMLNSSANSTPDEIHVSGGWTQINERWPLGADYYFYAATKGHHQLEIKIPDELAGLGLNVSFIYYFNHTEVRPTLQMVSCGNSYDAGLSSGANTEPGWYSRAIVLDQAGCAERKRLTLNILLHDAGDVFAVSFLEISDARPNLNSDMNKYTLASYVSSWDDGSEQFSSKKLEIFDLASELERSRRLWRASLGERLSDDDGLPLRESADSLTVREKLDRLLEEILSHRKIIRCWPQLCDRNMFVFSGLTALIGGFKELDRATLADSRHRFYLNSRNKPLKLSITDHSNAHDFAKEDVCFEFRLFMDTGVNISLSISDKNFNESGKLLEIFDRPADHWASGGWETIGRCMSSYLPRLTPLSSSSSSTGLSERTTINQLGLELKPHNGVAYEREKILVEFVAGRSESFREAAKVLNCLQDVSDVGDAKQIETIWTPSGGLVHVAKFNLMPPSANTSARPHLSVLDIEPGQQYLDLTSAWVVKPNSSAGPLERPTITLEYEFERLNWLEAIDFEIQTANPRLAATRWRSERIYEAKNRSQQQQDGGFEAISHNSKSFSRDDKDDDDDDSREFRVRLRHHLNRSPSIRGQVNLHNLTIRALSLGDACARNRAHCLNGSKCQPIGIMQLKCECRPGYSGLRCEHMQPCEVHYVAGLAGFEFCKLVGASCDPDIPVFRCVWPSDKYYQVAKVSALALVQAAQREESAEQGRLRALQANERKLRLIIIEMAIVMVGILLAALAFGIYLNARLVAANERLGAARSEAHELIGGRSLSHLNSSANSVGSRSVEQLTHNCV